MTRLSPALRAFAVLAALGSTTLIAACNKPDAAASPHAGTPMDSVRATLKAAKAKDIKAFKAGLTKNFLLTVERMQEMADARPEMKGAFDWPIFMNAVTAGEPKLLQEAVDGEKARVKAVRNDGVEVRIQLVREDDAWRMKVPTQFVTMLDHFDANIAKLKTGQAPGSGPDINRAGGGGKGGRVKALAADASAAEKNRAAALDAFDLGDTKGAQPLLEKAVKDFADDEEVVVSLGRLYVQKNAGDQAQKLFEAYVQKHDDALRARHFLGMAYMFAGRSDDAAKTWRAIEKRDAAYFKKHRLGQRAQIAERMAKGELPPLPQGAAGHGQPGTAPGH